MPTPLCSDDNKFLFMYDNCIYEANCTRSISMLFFWTRRLPTQDVEARNSAFSTLKNMDSSKGCDCQTKSVMYLSMLAPPTNSPSCSTVGSVVAVSSPVRKERMRSKDTPIDELALSVKATSPTLDCKPEKFSISSNNSVKNNSVWTLIPSSSSAVGTRTSSPPKSP